MFRKALIFAAVAAIGLLLFGGPARAATYPPDAPSIGTSASSVQNAGTTTVMGSGWQAGTTVALSIASTPQSLGNATVQSDGTFAQDVTIPCLDPGTHTISGSGTSASGAADTESTTVTVTGTCSANGGNGGTLPHTGSNSSGVITLASGLIILGAVLVIAINRRRSADL